VAEDPGKGQVRAGDAVPRQRGGAPVAAGLAVAPVASLRAAHAALATAAGHWTLTAAAVAGAVALVLACIGRRRTGD
jgi:hypothetical protein